MGMIDLFRMLSEHDSGSRLFILTVIEGDAFGAKCLLSDDRLIWETDDGFFSAHADGMRGIADTGIIDIAGRQVFCDQAGNERNIVICGGGHVGIAVLKLCRLLGYPVTLAEDRPEFAQIAREVGADRVICAPFAQALAALECSENTFFIIATREHRHDKTCLQLISRKKHAYIGLLGSRNRTDALRKALIGEGAPEDVIKSVYTPIGLAIGAETPAEIAVSVMAEVIQSAGRLGSETYSRELLRGIIDFHGKISDKRMALATIIHCEGPVPRGIGSKMLIYEDGGSIGSIGGGILEAEALKAACERFASRDHRPMIVHVDLSDPGASEKAVFCGGRADVLIEMISDG